MRGLIGYMAADFDERLEDFKEYMERPKKATRGGNAKSANEMAFSIRSRCSPMTSRKPIS